MASEWTEQVVDAYDLVDVGMAVYDQDNVLVHCNPVYLSYFAMYLDDAGLAGRRFEDIFREILREGGIAGKFSNGAPEEWISTRLEWLRNETTDPWEEQFADGRWVMFGGRSVGTGTWLHWCHDITRRKAAEFQIEAMTESTGHGFALWNQAGRLIRCTERFADCFRDGDERTHVGEAAAQVFARLARSGRLIFDKGEDEHSWVGAMMSARRNPVSQSLLSFTDDSHLLMEERRVGDGSTVTVLVDVTELKHREQNLRTYGRQLESAISELELSHAYLQEHSAGLSSMADELKRLLERADRERIKAEAAQRAATRSARDLEQSNADLQQFAYAVSHDLKEPLRTVSNYLKLLEKRYGDKIGDEGRELMALAVDGSMRMQTMIGDILEFSKVHMSGEEFREVGPNAVVEAVRLKLRAAIEDCGAEFDVGHLPSVFVDATQFERLFQNLIANALKYRAPDRSPRIRVEARRGEQETTFAVADNGIGIDARNFDRIFGVFQRLHGPTEYEGTGIGLAICKRIVERHGGDIRVESTPGQGSTFIFTIPHGKAKGAKGKKS